MMIFLRNSFASFELRFGNPKNKSHKEISIHLGDYDDCFLLASLHGATCYLNIRRGVTLANMVMFRELRALKRSSILFFEATLSTPTEFGIPGKENLQTLRKLFTGQRLEQACQTFQATEQIIKPGAYLRLPTLLYILPYLTPQSVYCRFVPGFKNLSSPFSGLTGTRERKQEKWRPRPIL
jgi:hypothetical protein